MNTVNNTIYYTKSYLRTDWFSNDYVPHRVTFGTNNPFKWWKESLLNLYHDFEPKTFILCCFFNQLELDFLVGLTYPRCAQALSHNRMVRHLLYRFPYILDVDSGSVVTFLTSGQNALGVIAVGCSPFLVWQLSFWRRMDLSYRIFYVILSSSL